MPTGGTAGQVLAKNTATNYDTVWVAGTPGPTGPIGPGYLATSTTSVTIGTGSQTFATQTGLAYTVGARARVASNGSPANWMEGTVTAYNSATGSLTINVDLTSP